MPKKNKNEKPDEFKKSVIDIVMNHSEKIDGLIGIVNDMLKNAPDYGGGLQLDVILENGKELTYYMVSDLYIDEPFLEFYYLVPADSSISVSLKSFPERSTKQTLRNFVRKVGKEKRWNRMHEQIHVGSIARTRILGYHTYSKIVMNEETEPNIFLDKGEVISLEKHRK